MRSLVSTVLGLVLLMALASPAEARRRGIAIITLGEDLVDVGPLPADEPEIFGGRVGYRYDRAGLFGLDFWRWGGEHVVYTGLTSSVTMYEPLPPEIVDELGYGTPWRYHVPPGLLLVLCLLELFVISRKRRPAKLALSAGGVLVVIALVLRLGGLTWEFIFPLLLGGHHLLVGLSAFRREREADNIERETIETPLPPKPRSEPELRRPPPNVETDPFRAPPQPPPIVVARPSAPQVSAPVVRDENASAPKLLT